ncbi:MAG: ATP-dependent DNA helicase RecG [Dehalococcoidia bacterium]
MDFKQLDKILELERSRGFADKAVSGGLDKFLARFAKEHPEQIRLPYPSYRGLTPAEREQWIDSLSGIPSAKKKPATPPKPPKPPTSLDSPISSLKGISTKLVPKFEKLGITAIRDLLYFFPRRHIDYSSPTPIARLQPEIEQTIMVKVWQATRKRARRMDIIEVIVGDDTATMKVNFFNQPYLLPKFTPSTSLIISGKATVWRGNRTFQPSSYEILDREDILQYGQFIPVYPLTEGLYPRQVRRLVKQALDLYLPRLEDFLPRPVRKNARLMGLEEAIRQAHYPQDESSRWVARRRLAFDELFLIQIGVLSKKRQRQEIARGIKLDKGAGYLEKFTAGLPFELTGAQKRALNEVKADLTRSKPMSRLLHGDVGSGKTVVATAAMLAAVAQGEQAALMAPTEILAEQHFNGICQLLGDRGGEGIIRSFDSVLGRPITLGLMTGSLRQKGKRELQQKVSAGEVDILIGTQALIQQKVEFKQLALAVVDEQHRFGVMQRLALNQKGISPHMLAMSATPIPRTLALTLYGDMDISLIDELPPGRQPIKTKWLGPKQRQSGYNFIRKQVSQGRQAYIICPLVEESEVSEARAATAEYERLSREIFPDLKLGLLHGRMSGAAKEEVMQQFRSGEIDVLVSTSVVEVGVDVPNATVMMVEGAERFGLSQLHQFRGRIWRSSHQAYCMLLADHPTEEGRERLATMEQTHNGFVLAEKDLEMRGPGEFFGTRQSGLPDLKMARLTDVKLLEIARREAEQLFRVDPKLQKSEHQALAAEVARLWGENNIQTME